MANISDILSIVKSRNSQQGEPEINGVLEQAKGLAENILSYQKEQRTAPVLKALQQYAGNWNAATDDQGRQAANTVANQIRANAIAGGISPMDLPSSNWGADPLKGVQTTQGFQSPLTGYEGLQRKDAIDLRRQAMLDALTQRVDEAGLTGIDPTTGRKTWERQYQEQTLANSAAKASSGGSGGSLSATDAKNQNLANAMSQLQPKLDAAWAENGWDGAVEALPQILAEIQANKPFLASGGVNTNDLVDYVYQTIGGFIKKGGRWIPDDGSGGDDADINLVGNP